MAMHVVLGDGEMTRRELNETLNDLWERAGDEPFWFILQGKSEPTDTDKTFASWLEKSEIYYEVVTDDEDSLADIYDGRQETHVAKKLGPKVVNLLKSKPEDDESADVLALFASDDPEAEEDRWLNSVIQQISDAGFKAYGLNDGLVEVDVEGSGEGEPEAEDEKPKPVKKTVAKKAVAKKAAAKPEAEPEAEYTREALEEMDLDALKKIAQDKGIDLPPRTRMTTYIDHILGEGETTPSVEVTPVAAGDGDIDIDALVDEVTDEVVRRLIERLQTVVS